MAWQLVENGQSKRFGASNSSNCRCQSSHGNEVADLTESNLSFTIRTAHPRCVAWLQIRRRSNPQSHASLMMYTELRIFARTFTDMPPARKCSTYHSVTGVHPSELRCKPSGHATCQATGFEFEDAGQSLGNVADMDPRTESQANPLGKILIVTQSYLEDVDGVG